MQIKKVMNLLAVTSSLLLCSPLAFGQARYFQATQTASHLAAALPQGAALPEGAELNPQGEFITLGPGLKGSLGPITLASEIPFNAVGVRVRGIFPRADSVRLEVNIFRQGSWSDFQEVILEDIDVAPRFHHPVRPDETYLGGIFLTKNNNGERLQYRIHYETNGSEPLGISEVVIAFMDTVVPGSTVPEVGGPETDPTARVSTESGYPKPSVVSRAQWGADSPQCSLSYCTVNHLCVHHTAVSSDYDDSNVDQCASSVRAIQDYHMYTNGWCDIGYNYLVCKTGDLFEGRAGGDDVKGAHDGYNCGSMGISFMGYYHPPYDQVPTAVSLDAIEELFAWKADQKGIDPFGVSYYSGYQGNMDNIYGHRDVNSGTSCPGDNLYVKLDEIRGKVYEKLHAISTPYANVSFVDYPTAVAVGIPFHLTVHYDTNLYEHGLRGKLVLDVKDIVTGKILANQVYDNNGTGLQGPTKEVEFTFTLNNPNNNQLYFLAYFTYLDGDYNNRLAMADTRSHPTTLSINPWADVSIPAYPKTVTKDAPFTVTVHYDTNLHELEEKGKLIIDVKDFTTNVILDSAVFDNNGEGIWGPTNDYEFTLNIASMAEQVYFLAYLTYLDGDYNDRLDSADTRLDPTTVTIEPWANAFITDFPQEVRVGMEFPVTVHYDTNLYEAGLRGKVFLDVVDTETDEILSSALYDNDGVGIQGPTNDYTFMASVDTPVESVYFRTYLTYIDGDYSNCLSQSDTKLNPTTVSNAASCGTTRSLGTTRSSSGGGALLVFGLILFSVTRRRTRLGDR